MERKYLGPHFAGIGRYTVGAAFLNKRVMTLHSMQFSGMFPSMFLVFPWHCGSCSKTVSWRELHVGQDHPLVLIC